MGENGGGFPSKNGRQLNKIPLKEFLSSQKYLMLENKFNKFPFLLNTFCSFKCLWNRETAKIPKIENHLKSKCSL